MERRSHPRVPLDTPRYAELFLSDIHHTTVLLVDVSPGGMQLAFSPGHPEPAELLGLPITLRDLPLPFDAEKKGIAGKIIWLAPQRCGVRFSLVQDIPQDQLAALAESL